MYHVYLEDGSEVGGSVGFSSYSEAVDGGHSTGLSFTVVDPTGHVVHSVG